MNALEKITFLDVRHIPADKLDVNYVVSVELVPETNEFLVTKKDGSTTLLPSIDTPTPKSIIRAYVNESNELIVVMSDLAEQNVGYVGDRHIFDDTTPVGTGLKADTTTNKFKPIIGANGVSVTESDSGIHISRPTTSWQYANTADGDIDFNHTLLGVLTGSVVSSTPEGEMAHVDTNPLCVLRNKVRQYETTQPATQILSSSSDFTADYGPWRAFDGIVTERSWYPAVDLSTEDAWLAIKFTDGTRTINGYSVYCRGYISDRGTPTDWILEARNDDADEWTLIHEVIADMRDGNGLEKSHILPAPVTYSQFRITITACWHNGAPGVRPFVSEMEYWFDDSLSGDNWKTLSFNRIAFNQLAPTITDGAMSLDEGHYYIKTNLSVWDAESAQIRIRDKTNNVTLLTGSVYHGASGNISSSDQVTVVGDFYLPAATDVAVEILVVVDAVDPLTFGGTPTASALPEHIAGQVFISKVSVPQVGGIQTTPRTIDYIDGVNALSDGAYTLEVLPDMVDGAYTAFRAGTEPALRSVTAENGLIYLIPYDGKTFFVYDPDTNTGYNIPSPVNISGTMSFSGGAYTDNGEIYLSPYTMASFCKIVPQPVGGYQRSLVDGLGYDALANGHIAHDPQYTYTAPAKQAGYGDLAATYGVPSGTAIADYYLSATDVAGEIVIDLPTAEIIRGVVITTADASQIKQFEVYNYDAPGSPVLIATSNVGDGSSWSVLSAVDVAAVASCQSIMIKVKDGVSFVDTVGGEFSIWRLQVICDSDKDLSHPHGFVTKLAMATPASTYKYLSCTYDRQNDKVLYVPTQTPNFRVYDPSEDVFEDSTFGLSLTGTYYHFTAKWDPISGNVVVPPGDNNLLAAVDLGYGVSKWTLETTPKNAGGYAKYGDMFIGHDGLMYAVPYSGKQFLGIEADTCSYHHEWFGRPDDLLVNRSVSGCYGADGRYWVADSNRAGYVLGAYTKDKSTKIINNADKGGAHFIAANDKYGNVYLFPHVGLAVTKLNFGLGAPIAQRVYTNRP